MANFQDNKVLTEEQIAENWEKFQGLCGKLGTRADSISTMLEEMGIRIATAPASSRREYHAAYPGGLVDHSLRVARYGLMVQKTFDIFSGISKESVIFACLFHDLGKVGEPGPDGKDYYVVETSEWHREKLGKYYKPNEDAQYMKNVDHTMHIFMYYGIKPSQDEFLAIRLNDGPADDMNRGYTMREPSLALLVQIADRMACEEEKQYA